MKRFAGIAIAILLAGVMLQTGLAQDKRDQVAPGDWPTINRDLAATRYSPLTQINASNVASLKEAWTYKLGGGGTSVPIVVNGVMFVSSGPQIVALDADTGKEIWTSRVPGAAPAPPTDAQASAPPAAGGGRRGGGPPGPTASARGVAYWPGDGKLPPRVLYMTGNRLVAIDAATGKPADGFGTDGSVTVGVPYGATPTIFRNVAIIGAASGETPQGPPGNPRAFDVRTGQKLWEFQTVPKAGEKFNDTWATAGRIEAGPTCGDSSRPSMWRAASPTCRLPDRRPTIRRRSTGNNVFANSIVAVDAQSGKYLWHFQTVHHDIWDTDMPSAGALFEFIAGRTTHARHCERRETELRVRARSHERQAAHSGRGACGSKGDVPTEWYSPTQPFPVRPAPLSRVSFNPETDLVRPEDTSPEHVAACKAMMEKAGGYYNAGPFTPFLFHETGAPPKSTIQFPGGTGGVNWGGMTLDPTTGIFFVNAQNTSLVGWVERKPPGVTYSFEAPNSNHPYDRASVNGVGPFFTFSAPLSGQYNEGRTQVVNGQTVTGPPTRLGRRCRVSVRRGRS
jgi:quinoprotein glucose dehydrogenase